MERVRTMLTDILVIASLDSLPIIAKQISKNVHVRILNVLKALIAH